MKEIKNNRIIYDNYKGRVAQHDEWLNQPVRNDSSPTFANLQLTGTLTIEQDLYVLGNTSVFNTSIIEFEDNIVVVNSAETSAGVTLNQAGLEVDRGTLENFRIVYNETNKRVEIGITSNLEPIAIRESIPLDNGIMIWNSVNSRIESNNQIIIPMTFTSTVNSVSSTTGSVIINGGVGIKKDIFIDGKINFVGSNLPNYSTIYTNPATNTLTLTSPQNINLTANQRIVVPVNVPIVFGSNTQAISSDTNNINITSVGDINLIPSTNKRVSVPNQIPITFSTLNEKVYTDSSNNMVIAGSQDIHLLPNNGSIGKKVFIPVSTSLAFGNVNQTLISNLSNDLIINAGNNINLNPGPLLNVKIPTNNGIILGGGGLQRISANSNNELNIQAVGDIFFTPSPGSAINIPNAIPITFYNDLQTISGDTNGNLLFNAQNQLITSAPINISNTIDSLNSTTGSVYTSGGLGVAKTITSESSIIVHSDNTTALKIKNNTNDLFTIDSSNSFGKINVYTGDGTSTDPSIEITNTNALNAKSLIQFKSTFDSTIGYMIGRGSLTLNSGRLFTFNLPSYSTYSNLGDIPRFSITSNNNNNELFSVESDTGNITSIGTFGLNNTNNSISPTTGSLILYGGLGVVKNIYTSGKVNISLDSTNAFEIRNNNLDSLLNIDTTSKILTVKQHLIIDTSDITNNTQAFAILNGGDTLLNINSFDNTFDTSLHTNITNTTDSSDTSSGSLYTIGGAAIQKKLNVGGMASFAASINMINTKITNLQDPTNPQDAATMNYVNLIKQGLFVKDSVDVASTIQLSISTGFIAGEVIDSYTLVLGDRILIKDQTSQSENGIYNVTNGIPTRTLDLQSGYEAAGIFTFVKNGVVNISLGFICNSSSPNDIVGTHSLNFTQFTGLGLVQAGDALSKNFNELNVNVDDSSIEIVSDSLRLKNTAVSTGLTGGSGTALTTTPDQSHVTKLGTINTGVWNGSVVQVGYGGTGKTTINSGNILYGNGINPVGTDTNFYYDSINVRLGLGTNSPSEDFEIKRTTTTTLFLNADSDANNANAKPEIKLSYTGATYNSYLAMTRNYDEYAANIYNDALILSNDQTDTSSIIQLATNQQARFTILSNGFIGINTSTPTTTLQVIGSFNTSGLVTFDNDTPSTDFETAAVVITGGLSIGSGVNATDINNGGGLTVDGGVSISQDLYIGGNINATDSESNSFSYITITATDEAINITTGSLVTFGGITIQCDTDASSVTNGGSLLSAGGASIGKSMYVGNSLYVTDDTFLGNLFFGSSTTDNYIESPDVSRTSNSFLPINFTQYNTTQENILTIANSGIILPVNHSLQIGGTLLQPDGYNIYYTTSNLNMIPNSTTSNYNINIGTIGNYSNLNIFGNDNGQIRWQSSSSNLLMTNSSIQLNKLNSTGSIVLTTPDTSNSSFLQASGANMIMNIGSGSTGGQLTTILSNNDGNSTITFTPSNITNSSLVLTNNVYSTFNGPVNNTDRVEYSGNALHQTINNTNGSALWSYFGQISTGGTETGYCEIDFNNGVSSTSDNDTSGLKLTVAIKSTTCIASHSHYGNIIYNSTQKPICYIYNDTFNDFHLFVKFSPTSETTVNVTTQRNTKFLLQSEGILSAPNGTFSSYTGSWTEEYVTNIESTIKYTTGDLTVEGKTLKISDNLPIIGYNNIHTTTDRDLGILFQRYQTENELGNGNIVNDSPLYIDSIPAQTGIVTFDQLRLSPSASSSDDFYNGWWIKVISGTNTNQVRQIIDYNGSLKIITLNSIFTTQLPDTGDTLYFFNNDFISNYFDSINNTFALGYVSVDPDNTYLISNNDADLRLKSLYSTDTTVSTNSTSGAIKLLGGISIDNTNDAVSSTYGSSITTRGGVGIEKNLLVGANIGLGGSGFLPQESLHVRKTIATTRYENDANSHSYIDFMENSTSNRYGVLLDSLINQLCLTNTSTSQDPFNSNRALTINDLGYVGINTTTNVVSPLSLNTTNFISTNSSTGFLGLIGAASNINDNSNAARILLHANSQPTVSSGSLNLYAGNNSTSGNVSVFTNNDIERVRVDYDGTVNILSTTISDSNTSGALVVTGGITAYTSQNATSVSSGGAITTPGGGAIGKDLYIGGSLYVNGAITVTGAVTSPTPVLGTLLNCSAFTYFNVHLLVNGTLATLTIGITITPDNTSENCEISIKLPSRTNNFTSPFEIISSSSGYTDSTNIIPLMNVLSYAVVGTTEINIKFQSASTNTHYLQLTTTYTII